MVLASRKHADAVRCLTRIRVAEKIEGDLRQVWHQAQGVDLLSHVDAKGHLARQELTLDDDFFVWTFDGGLRTGRVRDDAGSGAARASSGYVLDATIADEKVEKALEALQAYDGSDKYILHIRKVIAQVDLGDREPITLSGVLPRELANRLGASHEPLPPPSKRHLASIAGLTALATFLLLLAVRACAG